MGFRSHDFYTTANIESTFETILSSIYGLKIPRPVVKSDQLWALGVYDDKIAEMAKGGINDLKRKNGSRNIFAFIHKKNKTLPITISSITVPVRGKSRQKHIEQQKAWPILFLSDWMKAAFEPPYNGFFWLAGHKPDELDLVKATLRRFWDRYQAVEPIMPENPEITLPFFLHGDEGRGQCHRPVLVLAAQPVLGWHGEDCVTSQKNLGSI